MPLATVGCEAGGGASAEPSVTLRAVELEDDDMATEPVDQSDSEMPVLAPNGEAIVPPGRRSTEAPADEAADE